MLDGLTASLLRRLCELNGGGYTLFDEEELLALFPPKANADKRGAEDCLRYLAEHKLIELDYAAEGTYCVRPLPEGRLCLERAAEKKREGRRSALLFSLFSALSGAAGAFLGALLALSVC